MTTGDALVHRLADVALHGAFQGGEDEPFAISPAEFKALPPELQHLASGVQLTIWGRRVVVTELWVP